MTTNATPDAPPLGATSAVAHDVELAREHLSYALRLASLLGAEPAHAEDIASEAVAKLLAARHRTRVDQPTAYLRRVVLNALIGRRRRQRTEQRLGHRFVAGTTTSDQTDRVAIRRSLDAVLGMLTARQRAILVLRYYEDLPVGTVATMLGISAGTVKSTASDALASLRRHIDEDGNDG